MSGTFTTSELSRIAEQADRLMATLPLTSRLSLSGMEISSEAVKLLPAEFVKRNRVLPIKLVGGTLHIATEQPGNQRVIEDIRLLTGFEVEEIEVSGSEVLSKIA